MNEQQWEQLSLWTEESFQQAMWVHLLGFPIALMWVARSVIMADAGGLYMLKLTQSHSLLEVGSRLLELYCIAHTPPATNVPS